MNDSQEQSYLRSLFDRIPTGILIADDDARYVDANETICMLLDRTRDEIIGHNLSEIIDQERTAEVDAQWLAFLRDGSQSGLFTVLLPDGTPRQLRFHAYANFLPGLHCSFLTQEPQQPGELDSDDSPVTMCAWTKQIKHEGEWISIEQYLLDVHGIRLSHGLSPNAFPNLPDE